MQISARIIANTDLFAVINTGKEREAKIDVFEEQR